jgi:hypothetical protein
MRNRSSSAQRPGAQRHGAIEISALDNVFLTGVIRMEVGPESPRCGAVTPLPLNAVIPNEVGDPEFKKVSWKI